jgi:hypothetical protein
LFRPPFWSFPTIYYTLSLYFHLALFSIETLPGWLLLVVLFRPIPRWRPCHLSTFHPPIVFPSLLKIFKRLGVWWETIESQPSTIQPQVSSSRAGLCFISYGTHRSLAGCSFLLIQTFGEIGRA